MAGPIDFASDGPVDTKGPTEFGGTAGLIENGRGSGPGGVFSHSDDLLTADEERGVLVRAKSALRVDPVTGFEVADPGGDATDPVSGRVVGPWNEDGGHPQRVTDYPPKTQSPS